MRGRAKASSGGNGQPERLAAAPTGERSSGIDDEAEATAAGGGVRFSAWYHELFDALPPPAVGQSVSDSPAQSSM